MSRIAILTVIAVFAASPAWAGIGAVGNPNLPKPAETVAAGTAPAPAEEQKKEESKPLLEIAFDKNYVNYTRALTQGIAAAERAKRGVVYTVVSYLPEETPSSLQNRRMMERAETNLRAVVGAMNQRGVPTERIFVRTERGTGNYDVVKIFVE